MSCRFATCHICNRVINQDRIEFLVQGTSAYVTENKLTFRIQLLRQVEHRTADIYARHVKVILQIECVFASTASHIQQCAYLSLGVLSDKPSDLIAPNGIGCGGVTPKGPEPGKIVVQVDDIPARFFSFVLHGLCAYLSIRQTHVVSSHGIIVILCDVHCLPLHLLHPVAPATGEKVNSESGQVAVR